MNQKEAKGIMIEICAEYNEFLKRENNLFISSEKERGFVKHRISSALTKYLDKKISIHDFIFLCKIYGFFYENYTFPTEEEKMKYNLSGNEIEKALVCIERACDGILIDI